MYTFRFIVGNIIPKSVKCIHSATKDLRGLGFRGFGFGGFGSRVEGLMLWEFSLEFRVWGF